MTSPARVFAVFLLFGVPLAASQTPGDATKQQALDRVAKELRETFPNLAEGISSPEQLGLELGKQMSQASPAALKWKPVKDPQAEKIAPADPRVKNGIIDCPCSPSNRTDLPRAASDLRKQVDELGGLAGTLTGDVDTKSFSTLRKLGRRMKEVKEGYTALKELLEKCTSDVKMEGCVNVDKELRASGKSMRKYDSKTGKNIFNGTTVGTCDLSTEFRLADEGCVAVEHLKGYVLQHPTHLLRPVMCARGFCATPNHAILVNGVYTSMKRMCAGEWECTRRETLVNNLKVAANRHARVGEEIVVTPYDTRFPKVVIWGVQMLEDVWHMLAISVCSGTLAGAAVLLLSKIGKSNKLL